MHGCFSCHACHACHACHNAEKRRALRNDARACVCLFVGCAVTDPCGTVCSFARAVVEGACRTVQVVCECACECACGKACGLSRVQRMTGPESPWCRETPCGAWLCGLAEEAGLRMGWFMAVAKMAVIRAL